MNRIKFTVNGKKCFVRSGEVTSEVMLLDYIRETLELRGTKYMCREGGCGACVLLARRTEDGVLQSVNSCLVSVTSCQGWDITTIEDLGNKLKGYHKIQQTLADHNGSQCGYCSPGWVMSMQSLLEHRGSELTMLEIEKSFASNICRCTGYRPILEAFKTFAKDAPKISTNADTTDIEDLDTFCKITGNPCNKNTCEDSEWCFVDKEGEEVEKTTRLRIELKDNKLWYVVYQINDVFNIFDDIQNKSYMLVAGNTGKGAFPIDEYPDVLIDISRTMKGYTLGQNLILGAGNTLTETMDIFTKVAEEDGFDYLKILHKHLDLVAHIAVRNIGTVGGNLMLKHDHHEFQSDIFLLFETIGAMVTIVQSKKPKRVVSMRDFLKTDMKNNILVNVFMPPLSSEYRLVTYKQMPRAQNAVATVNAGFLYKLDANNTKVLQARIVYGNINPTFIHALRTEMFLTGKMLFRNDTLQSALKMLSKDLETDGDTEETRDGKKAIALGLFYKGLLTISPENLVDSEFKSGITNYSDTRPVSSGKQVFDTDPLVWPVNKPIPKLEGLIQCAGEAKYIDDMPEIPGEVFSQFVITTAPNGIIDKIDSTDALGLEGVIAFYLVKDLPRLNSFTALSVYGNTALEEQFCDGTVKFNGQPIGVIVAETRPLAERAAKLVKISYKASTKPVLDIPTAKKDPVRTLVPEIIPATNKGLDVMKHIKGSASILGQYHFHMEKQLCVTIPLDDGFEVLSSSQYLDHVQIAIQQSLNLDENALTQSVRRLGGAFGAKISRANQIAIACTLVSLKLNRPCRMVLPLVTNMKAIGKRLPCFSEFEVDVNNKGKIQSMAYKIYSDNGYMFNEPLNITGISAIGNAYDKSTWSIQDYNVLTETAKNSWCRAPGTLDHIAMTEFVMEQITYELDLDPVDVRRANLYDDKDLKAVIENLLEEAEYDKRKDEVENFNKENRWKKRGLGFVPLKWPLPLAAYFTVTVMIYHGDGTVAIVHGGVEMGQGINTKAAQVCSYKLKIPIEKIKVKPTNNLSSPNSMITGGSFTSESICKGVINCCDTLLERLAPYGDVTDWVDKLATAFKDNVDLSASTHVSDKDLKTYDVYGTTLAEVEVDMLTGEHQIIRVDLMEDVGKSLSPEIDVGQIEGAFIMSLGYWTCEELKYDEDSGELLTDRTWNYHVPQARDIPLDFRVYFRRNAKNPAGVLGSKATGEPATCMGIAVPFAIRAALSSSRVDSGKQRADWFNLFGPHTNVKIAHATGNTIDQYLFSKDKPRT